MGEVMVYADLLAAVDPSLVATYQKTRKQFEDDRFWFDKLSFISTLEMHFG
jgi:hypothetical protein